MPELHDYFVAWEPGLRSDPVETGWMGLDSLKLGSGTLVVSDADLLPYPDLYGEHVDLLVGRYQVQAKVMDYGDDARISRLRVLLSGRDGSSAGSVLAEAWTDSGALGVCDYRACSDLGSEHNEEELFAFSEGQIYGKRYGVAQIDESTGLGYPFVESGFGDGVFPIRELLDAEERVGIEVEFIQPGEECPFD